MDCYALASTDFPEAVRDARVVRLHTEEACDERSVCSVTAPRERKTAVKPYLSVYRPILKELARHPAYAHSAGGVAA